jgi:hypothetical protein
MDAAYFREKARQVRHFADIAMNREVRDALDQLALEFEEQAVQLERSAGGSLAQNRD